MKKRLFILLQYVLPHHRLSRSVAKIAEAKPSPKLLQAVLRWFVRKNNIDMHIAAQEDLAFYQTFNQFFTRKLKPNARPIETGIVSPADGTVSEFGHIDGDKILQVKGQYYSLMQLVPNPTLANLFKDGEFITIYLSPRDYHRVHMPYAGHLIRAIYVPGKLFSVNPTTVENIDGVFARNERLICEFETDRGPMIVIFVGAMLVAGIVSQWQGVISPNKTGGLQEWQYPNKSLFFDKGDELGYFNFGSTVICLFPTKSVNWQPSIAAHLHLNMGQSIASFN